MEGMYYCFIKQDIDNLDEHDPLSIQVRYADRIGKLLFCDIDKGLIYDGNSEGVTVKNEDVFLRGTCDHFYVAETLLLSAGANLLETTQDADRVEHWENYVKIGRNIYSVKVEELLERSFDNKIFEFLRHNEKVFLKTRKKGCSIGVSSKKILNVNSEFVKILKELERTEDMLLSAYYEVGKDSLGKKEARFFILNQQIQNCSRVLHSVKHTVPQKFKEKALECVEALSKSKEFPINYVLDLGEFLYNDGKKVDIVEINPISYAMCYINNSIYKEMIPEIEQIKENFGAGYEYCYDVIASPELYVYRRNVGDKYEYVNTSYYDLLSV